MNQRSRTFRLLFSLVIFTTVGCTTYEDGPKLSLQTADTRLVGKWVLTAVGDESLLGTAEYEFRDDWSFKASEDPITGLEGEVNGSWSWQGEEQKTILIRPDNTGTVLYFEVRRLTSNELKVRATSRGTDESLDTTMEYRKI